MTPEKLQELNTKLSQLLKEFDCNLQVAHTIQVVPNKMEENTQETVVETPAEEVA